MQQVTLEREFEEFKALHKYAIVKCKAVQYFRDIEDGMPTIPDFMRKGQTPEDLADKFMRQLLCLPDGGKTFNKLYETAYEELAEVLD